MALLIWVFWGVRKNTALKRMFPCHKRTGIRGWSKGSFVQRRNDGLIVRGRDERRSAQRAEEDIFRAGMIITEQRKFSLHGWRFIAISTVDFSCTSGKRGKPCMGRWCGTKAGRVGSTAGVLFRHCRRFTRRWSKDYRGNDGIPLVLNYIETDKASDAGAVGGCRQKPVRMRPWCRCIVCIAWSGNIDQFKQ